MTKKFITETGIDAAGNRYEYVPGDDYHVRIYTLENGLKIFLTQNFDEPVIRTYIPVRVGSKYDPADNTGLAHYLEHMMFKGSSKLGTLDWEKESPLLDKISDLYEKHKAENNPGTKAEIYKEIDKVSAEAAKYAVPNEYDQALSALGAWNTNAHTWLDETVYKTTIPANELEKWLKIESDRFSHLAMRLFHTEMEVVYEEYNRGQDTEARMVNNEMMSALFPSYPEGQLTTIGKPEHLKNPSMKALKNYFQTYYVPNNFAVILVGDFQFEKTVALIDQYFGALKPKPLPERTIITEKPLTEIVRRTVKTPSSPKLKLAWRTEGYGSRQAVFAQLIANMMMNSSDAGLIDLNILKAQKALSVDVYAMQSRDFGSFTIEVIPKEQTLEEAETMILEQIQLIKDGEFQDWLVTAILKELRITRIKTMEIPQLLGYNLCESYIREKTWAEELNSLAAFEGIAKTDIQEFAKEFFKDNYVAVYKISADNDLILADKPEITPIALNRDVQSEFLQELLAMPTEEIDPQFSDYRSEILEEDFNGNRIAFVQNKNNDAATLNIYFPVGRDHDPELAVAVPYLQFLGTSNYSRDALAQEFFRSGISYNLQISADKVFVSLCGLEEDIPRGTELIMSLFSDARHDDEVYQEAVQTIIKSREVMKTDMNHIMRGLKQYAMYGKNSRFRDQLSEEELRKLNPKNLVEKIKDLPSLPFEIYFYGKDLDRLKSEISHLIPTPTRAAPDKRIFPEPETDGKVYFVDYDMVQVDVTTIAKSSKVDVKIFGLIEVFNEYFGRGLSSVVFQEIRERKSLAYSAYAFYGRGAEINRADYLYTSLGTQPDKLGAATEAIQHLMKELPRYPEQFENAKTAALKKISASRLTRMNYYFAYMNEKKLGIDYDLRKELYQQIEGLTWDDLAKFYSKNVKALKFNTALMGSKKNINKEAISKLGELVELTTEEIFNF